MLFILLKESNESKILQEEAHCLRIPRPVRAKAGGRPSGSGGGRGEWERGSVESETGGRAEQLQVNTRDRPQTLTHDYFEYPPPSAGIQSDRHQEILEGEQGLSMMQINTR